MWRFEIIMLDALTSFSQLHSLQPTEEKFKIIIRVGEISKDGKQSCVDLNISSY